MSSVQGTELGWTGAHYIDQDGLELAAFLLLLPCGCCDHTEW